MSEIPYYTVSEMATISRVTPRTIRNRAEAGEYPGIAVKLAGDWLFDRERLEAALGRRLPDPKGVKQ